MSDGVARPSAKAPAVAPTTWPYSKANLFLHIGRQNPGQLSKRLVYDDKLTGPQNTSAFGATISGGKANCLRRSAAKPLPTKLDYLPN